MPATTSKFIFPLLFYKRVSDVWDEEYQAALAESDGDLSYAEFAENHREDMQPLLDKAADIKAAVVDLKECLKQLKKDKADESEIEALESDIREKEKAARDLEAQAAAIDAGVFDLKAVNPNAVAAVDARTPDEIIESIATQGRIVADALERLKQFI